MDSSCLSDDMRRNADTLFGMFDQFCQNEEKRRKFIRDIAEWIAKLDEKE